MRTNPKRKAHCVNRQKLRDILVVETQWPSITATAEALKCISKPEDITARLFVLSVGGRGKERWYHGTIRERLKHWSPAQVEWRTST